MDLSICTTNYNCAHALLRHLESVYRSLDGLDFEYIVVDNKSADSSLPIMQKWAATHSNMKVFSRRCTMGEGRQIAFLRSRGTHILVIDTDVVYSELLRAFVETYLRRYQEVSVQAIQAGLFPRNQWIRAGGRRSLNTNEDADMWLRINTLGTMRWYPVPVGENLKDAGTWGRADHFSSRYGKSERVLRLFRRELDLIKTAEVERTDLATLIASRTIDMGIGPNPGAWPQHRSPERRLDRLLDVARELKQLLGTS